MNSHIKEHPTTLLAVLIGAILIFSVVIYALMPSAPAEELLPEASAAPDDSNLLRRPEVSMPEISSGSLWTRPVGSDEPEESEEPTIGVLETSSRPEEPSDEPEETTPGVTVSQPEESSVPEPSQPSNSDPITEPITGPEPEYDPSEGSGHSPSAYTVKVCVTSTSGKLLSGVEVTVGDVTGKTGSDGYFSATVTDPDSCLLIVSPGYISYYEDLLLTASLLDTTVVLAPIDTTRRLLNSVDLHPYRTDNAALNAALDKLLGEIIKPGMDTYEKVKTCYDWVIAHMYYKRPSHKEQGYWACAYQALQDGYGTCNCYSLLFTAMMRHIGLNCYYVEGSTSASGGGMTGHFWTIIEIGGEFYVFDPQVEDAIADRTSSKEVTYSRFCLKEPHSKYVYDVRSRSSCVKNFESYLQSHGNFLA